MILLLLPYRHSQWPTCYQDSAESIREFLGLVLCSQFKLDGLRACYTACMYSRASYARGISLPLTGLFHPYDGPKSPSRQPRCMYGWALRAKSFVVLNCSKSSSAQTRLPPLPHQTASSYFSNSSHMSLPKPSLLLGFIPVQPPRYILCILECRFKAKCKISGPCLMPPATENGRL